MVALGLHCCKGFSLVAASGDHSRCGARASHRGGFSCCGAQALGCVDFSSCAARAQYLQLAGSVVQCTLV